MFPMYNPVCILLETPFSRWKIEDKKDFFQCGSNGLEVSHTEEVECTESVATDAFPSNLVMVKTASGKNVLLKVVPQTSNIPKTYILKPANIVRSTSVLNADTLNDSTTGQEVITEEGGIKEVTDSVESGAKVEGQNEEPFLCENLFDSCTNGEVFINEIILEDNINEVVMEQNVNEVTIDNTTDSTVKEIVLDNMLHV